MREHLPRRQGRQTETVVIRGYRFTQILLAAVLTGALIACGPGVKAAGQVKDVEALFKLDDSLSLLGSYLAGRLARSQRDIENASQYFRRALEKEPDNKVILEEAFQLAVASGQWEEAKLLGQQLIKEDKEHRVARFFLGIDAFRQNDFKAADAHFQAAGKGPIAELTANLASAWINVAKGKLNAALTQLDRLNKAEWAQQFERRHRAMIADLASRQQMARQAYVQAYKKNSRSPRVAEAYARHAAYWRDEQLAEKILTPFLSRANPNPLAKALMDEISAGVRPKLIAASAAEGMAEVFYSIGEALMGDGGIDAGQIYLQLALFAHSNLTVGHFALAEIYENVKAYDLAILSFDRIPETSPLWASAQIKKAFHLHTLERPGEAKVLLERLLEKDPADLQILQALGNILRGEKKYGEAVAYYTRAIDLVKAPDKRHWSLYYARGISHERLKQWPKAEADLKKALQLDAEQGLVLNYLGYSWIDQNLNLKEAMELIRKAVQLKPNDGYFVDSLGWAYYRQKNYKQALKYLERAVELRPEDPVINDHLGDIYWLVGRKLEAQYQWSQALTLNPEAEDIPKIRTKLEKGLPAEANARAARGADAGEKPDPGLPGEKPDPGLPGGKPEPSSPPGEGTGTPN